jgi:hypothetical protein
MKPISLREVLFEVFKDIHAERWRARHRPKYKKIRMIWLVGCKLTELRSKGAERG